MHRDAGHRGQRVLSRLNIHQDGEVRSRLLRTSLWLAAATSSAVLRLRLCFVSGKAEPQAALVFSFDEHLLSPQGSESARALTSRRRSCGV